MGIKPIFVVGGLYSKANGIAWIMSDLAAAMGRAGTPVTVYAADCPGRKAKSIGEIFQPPSRYVTAPGTWLGGLSWSPRLYALLREAVSSADVIHNHSFWMLPTSYATRLARKATKPVLFTAHGALDPWALRNSRLKKRFADFLFQNRDLKIARCIHVNSRRETEGVRRLGLRCSVAVIPNGIHLPDFDDLPNPDHFLAFCPAARDHKILLFLGRLHRKKGVDLLLRAWGRVQGELRDWHLVVAGPDDGLGGELLRIAGDLEIANRVTFTGHLSDVPRKAALAAASAFVLPSHSEGFSMAVLEAMACRLPVLLTPMCNFPEAVENDAAMETTLELDGLESRLLQLCRGMSESDRKAMGERGRMLVSSRYTWERVAEQTLGLYRWLKHGGAVPDYVDVT